MWQFYNEDDPIESQEDSEPSFYFYDFKKWLSKQKKQPKSSFKETVENTSKENMKESFKNKMIEKTNNNIEKKLEDLKNS